MQLRQGVKVRKGMCCASLVIERLKLICLQRQAITDNPEWALQRRRSRATAERSRASLADQSARAGERRIVQGLFQGEAWFQQGGAGFGGINTFLHTSASSC